MYNFFFNIATALFMLVAFFRMISHNGCVPAQPKIQRQATKVQIEAVFLHLFWVNLLYFMLLLMLGAKKLKLEETSFMDDPLPNICF